MTTSQDKLPLHPGSIPSAMSNRLAKGLGARLVTSPVRSGRMIVFLDARITGESWLRSLDRPVLCAPPDIPVRALDPLSRRSGNTSPARLVVHTPMHHLYAVERLGFDPTELELIPWSIDIASTASPATVRDESMLVEVRFPGSEADFARRAGLGREAQVKVITFGDDPRCLKLIAKAGVVLIAPADCETGAGTEGLLAAMALGAPIVAAKTWGFEHLLIPGVEGSFFNVGDVTQARREIRRLLSDPEVAHGLGQVARAKFATTLTLDHYIARLLRIVRGAHTKTAPEFFLIAAHGRAEGSAPA